MSELEQLKRDNEVLYRDNVSLSETADRLREALERAIKQIESDHCLETDWLGLCYTCELPLNEPEEDEHFTPGHHADCQWVKREAALVSIRAALEVKP